MEQKQVTIEDLNKRLLLIESALRSKGISIAPITEAQEDDEGEFTDEFKALLEKRRKSNNYLPHEEVKRRILAKK